MPIKKRFIAAINIKEDLVVQSINYSKYLPLGKVENYVECFDRWNVDEILLQDFTRSKKKKGPNFSLLEKISMGFIKTPLIYSGDIRTASQAIKVINLGADRIVLGSTFFKNEIVLKDISKSIGSQAIILSLPIIEKGNDLFFYNYYDNQLIEYSIILSKLKKYQNYFSEIFITDVRNQGLIGKFNLKILKKLTKLDYPVIFYGGIGLEQINEILKFKNSSAFALGNCLAYKELNYHNIIKKVKNKLLRNPIYSNIRN